MKNLYLLFIAFLILQFTSLAQQDWFQQESGTQTQLNSVFFLDSLNGWVVGNDSTILRTTNGGNNWISLASGFNNYNYNDVFFISDSMGWVVGSTYEAIILFTLDAGQSWEGMTIHVYTNIGYLGQGH